MHDGKMTNVALLGYKGAFSNATGSGVNRYMYELYHNMDLLAPKRIRIHTTEVENSLMGRRPPFLPFLLKNIMKSYGAFDIVHNAVGNMLYLPLKKSKTTYITTSFEFAASKYPELVVENYRDPLRAIGMAPYVSMLGLTERLQLGSDHMIAISTLTRDDAISLGYEKDRVSVVNLGIDERFMGPTSAPRARRGFKVGYIGSFVHKKNVVFAVRAFKMLDDPKACMEIWGKKADTAAYGQMAAEAQADRRISLMGFLPEDRIVDAYDSFSVYVHPVLYTGFELEIIEAQARGVPVIVCKGGRIPDEVKKYCFQAKDEGHMAEIMMDIRDNGYSEKARRRATEYARGFTWERTARETLAVYEKVRPGA